MLHQDYDVAIIGLGPVGGVLGCLLGQKGHRVLVVESHAAPYPLPRAVHFDHETARILQSCGFGAELGDIAEPGDVYEWRNGDGQVLLRFASPGGGPSGWPSANMFWQPALEARIEAALGMLLSVTIRRGVELQGLSPLDEGVSLTIGRPSSSAPGDTFESTEELSARYVVGCDGANSTVRALLDIEMDDLGFHYDWLIVDVVLDEERTFDPVNVQICDPARPTTAVSGGPGRRRWEFMRLPHESIDELNTTARAWELLEPWGVTSSNATLERHAVYTFQARWASEWRRGRILLAGDAAHLTPPFAGQGMCAGIRDAANVSWKLDLVMRDLAPDALLDAYGAERSDNAQAFIAIAVELGKVICVSDPAEAAARDEAMAAAMDGIESQPMPPMPGVTAGVIASGDPLAGTLFIQGRVRRGERIDRFDDVFGAGWRLITVDLSLAPAISDEDRSWFESIGGSVVELGSDAEDVDGTYAAWFAEHGVRTALQRPDFYLFGAADDVDHGVGLVHSLKDMLTGRSHPTTQGAP